MLQAPEIPGAEEVVAWFGYWPTFHDAEVVSINLDRKSGCRLVINAFRMTSALDEEGKYVCAKHAIVTFVLEGFPMDENGIVNNRIDSFNQQNVLSSLWINRIPEGYEMVLEGCYGVEGKLVASHIAVELEPA